ncbi:hypothetical protein [Cryobacterium soli]|uniref:hypothetical protein n=1 Tax=Cryobacterium soli TaxID=2220095 RepID=UPI000E72C08F|nr:hypothetical protein [Cryobacterium soli]
MTPPAWRWSFLLTRILFALLVVSVPLSRILRSLSDDTDRAFSSALAGITAVAVVGIVTVGLSMRVQANATVRKLRDTLAVQHPGGAFLVLKTSRMQSDLKSLKPDLYETGWNRWSTALVVTVDDESFTIWDRDGQRAAEVMSIPWSSVMTATINRAGVGAQWMDAVVTRVHSGPIKIDLVFPPGAVRRGLLWPAEPAEAAAMSALFAARIQVSHDQAEPLEKAE